MKTCNATGTAYGACVGAVEPIADACGHILDSNCNGIVDEGCVCVAGSTAACYGGPAGTEGLETLLRGRDTWTVEARDTHA